MKLTFYGGTKMVTGSCFGLEVNGKKIIVDCGLKQGRDDVGNDELPFDPAETDFVVVTHAHIDHSGRLPLLKKLGFKGAVYATRLTAELLSIMLRDSAYIQEMEARWKNQKGKRAGRDIVEPLYTIADAEGIVEQIVVMDYGDVMEPFQGIKLRFTDAGHLLGSASVELWLEEDEETRKIVFSGDIGNYNHPIIRDPQYIRQADYVVMESTYGDREHEPYKRYTKELAEILNRTFKRGGNAVFPSFAVGRTQELLYYIREIKQEGLVTTYPDFEVYVDSPLASEATSIYSGNLKGYIDEEAKRIIMNGESMFRFDGLKISKTTEESKALNEDMTPKVIISASGMCEAGRIRHHLKHNLWRKECTVVFVGFQAQGTLGRLILDGAKKVRLFGEEIAVNAEIVRLKGLSSHADKNGLIRWVKEIGSKPRQIFVVHGEAEASEKFAASLRQLGYPAEVPDLEQSYNLITGHVVKYGIPVPKKKVKGSQAYISLMAAGNELMSAIEKSRDMANKELLKLAGKIRALLEEFKS
ncbi:MAG: MBL fold metallo-hydrolase [Clostridiales bacterium]|nr:MBL fold metallo-hydrolase [Clostridiales bacterium]